MAAATVAGAGDGNEEASLTLCLPTEAEVAKEIMGLSNTGAEGADCSDQERSGGTCGPHDCCLHHHLQGFRRVQTRKHHSRPQARGQGSQLQASGDPPWTRSSPTASTVPAPIATRWGSSLPPMAPGPGQDLQTRSSASPHTTSAQPSTPWTTTRSWTRCTSFGSGGRQTSGSNTTSAGAPSG